MFNLNFTDLKSAMASNNMNEAQIVHHLKAYFKNQNYRKGYQKARQELTTKLANDPVVQKRLAELKKVG